MYSWKVSHSGLFTLSRRVYRVEATEVKILETSAWSFEMSPLFYPELSHLT